MLVGYAPLRQDFSGPGDRRRFLGYANRRSIKWEVATVQGKYDLVVLSQGADLSSWATYTSSPIIFDFVDAYLSESVWSPKSLFRGLFYFLTGRYRRPGLHRRLLLKIIKKSAAIVCASAYQADLVRKYNHSIFIIGDYLEEFKYIQANPVRDAKALRMLWEGLGSNLFHLKRLREPLALLKEIFDFELNVVSDRHDYTIPLLPRDNSKKVRGYLPGIKLTFRDWNLSNWSSACRESDIAVIPFGSGDKLSRGKPSNKIEIFFRVGLLPLVSPNEAYRTYMDGYGTPELVCYEDRDWVGMLCSAKLGLSPFDVSPRELNRHGSMTSSSVLIDNLWANVIIFARGK